MTEGFKVEGLRGTWYEVDTKTIQDTKVLLIESCERGSDAPHAVISADHKVLYGNEWNWFNDYEYALESEGLAWGQIP